MVFRLGSGKFIRRSQSRWLPTYTFHDPNPPLTLETPAGGFPTQFFGLKAFFQGVVKDLCLVAEADAPTGIGGVIKVLKGTTKYIVYLVETSDPQATPIRVRTSTGTKAVRIKT